MLRTEGNGHRHTPSVQHSCGGPEGARSRKPRPVLCLGNRALNGRPTGDAEVGVARCPVTERLVGSDAVVDVAEAGGLRWRAARAMDPNESAIGHIGRASAAVRFRPTHGAFAQVRRIRARLKGAQKSAPRTYGPSTATPFGV